MGRITLNLFIYLIIFLNFSYYSFSSSTTTLINNQLKKSPNLGIYIKNLTNGKVISSHNSNKKLIPASNQKILTTLCSLEYLGSDYKFDTFFFINNPSIKAIENKDINNISGRVDNFYVETRGDPTLTSRDLKKIVAFFKQSNLKVIEGNIILDNRYFEPPFYNKSWKKAWKGLAWAPHISSVSIDENYYKSKKSNELLITDRPLYLLGVKLKRELRRQGIRFKGNIILSKIPLKKKLNISNITYKHSSKDLIKIINIINKKSHNLYAENLFKKLSAKYNRTPGSWNSSAEFLSSFLSSNVGLDENTFNISDGSGLSRGNRISTKSMVSLLEFAKHKEYFLDFYQSLPLAGVEGTLVKRFKSKPLYKNLRAKTGYIFQVSSLSGYFKAKNGDLYAFSIIVNNYNYSVRPFIDKLLSKIYYQ